MAKKPKPVGKKKPRPARPAKRRRAEGGPEITVCSRQQALRVSPARLRRLIEFVARAEGQPIAAVDLAIVDSSEMAGLGRRYLRLAGPTDVLSFDLSEAKLPGIVAQILVSGDQAVSQGPVHGYKPNQELMLYVIHGLLHVMGYDDTAVRRAARMHARQEQLLAEFLTSQKRKSR